MPLAAAVDLQLRDVRDLANADALAALLQRLGYPTDARRVAEPTELGLAGDAANAVKKVELLAEDAPFFRVYLVVAKSVTAKLRQDLSRALGKTTVDHLLALTADFESYEFVLLDRERSDRKGPAGVETLRIVPRVWKLVRTAAEARDLRTLRALSWTASDALDQFDRIKHAFLNAEHADEHFQNRGLFSDHYLKDAERLRDDPHWKESPNAAFAAVRDLWRDAPMRWRAANRAKLWTEGLQPLLAALGFRSDVEPASGEAVRCPLTHLGAAAGGPRSAGLLAYGWDRWLDGADAHDAEFPDENPGARAVSELETLAVDWLVVTNGRQWRLYGKKAHARATNFYEVDLGAALDVAGGGDPNVAFRYWWLFFRPQAFAKPTPDVPCWLDGVLQSCRDYAKRLGDRLKDRTFVEIFPHLAHGFLHDRRRRLGLKKPPTEAELADVFEGTLTLLYRLLFLLFAESRDLLPLKQEPKYRDASLHKLKEEIAAAGGVSPSAASEKLDDAYADDSTILYERLQRLFAVMDRGDADLNVPTYNGGLFDVTPDATSSRQGQIARFLLERRVPDRFLAQAVDRLTRDEDERTAGLVFIDYKSLEVRHLGSIYEGLLEFKLRVASEDLAVVASGKGKGERYVSLTEAKPKGRGRNAQAPAPAVKKGEVYLANDNADRKATGSYYTPDPIVEYIVAHTVGPVLDAKLEALRPEFRGVRKRFDDELQKSRSHPSPDVTSGRKDHRAWAGMKTYAAFQDTVERFFDLKVLDPAMGSGHFLVEVVDFVTDRMLHFLDGFPINPVRFALDDTRAQIRRSLDEQGVAVDKEKLTDVHLLKRHVLKRCVYGVDLNPMAVELAKVSLWLDAFTLGAPLNFLDHHLRCGNSLVGATLADLNRSDNELFSLDYEPMNRAIDRVLLVARLTDATAGEVAKSENEYAAARRSLVGYQILLDIVVARHFGLSEASAVLQQGNYIDLSSRESFDVSLAHAKERRLVAQVEALAQRPDRRFFHWEIEFPEVYFDFRGIDRRQVVHRNELAPGSAGFDCVVGNPPYDVLAEKELETDLTEMKGYIEAALIYRPAKGGKQNLYKLFVCRNVDVARQGGRVGNIVPMPLLGDEQAVGVRKMLLGETSLAAVEAFPQKDDPKNRVFEDAKLSTCIFVTVKTVSDEPFRARIHPGKDIRPDSPSLLARRDQAQLYDPENQPIVVCSQEDWDLAARIMSSGRMRRLGEFCTAYQGEVNETTDGKKGNVAYEPKGGQIVVRGSAICLYVLRTSSQGEDFYLRVKKYLAGKSPGTKAWHHRQNRVGVQESCPQNNFRRIIAASIPKGEFCNHVINYFPEDECKVPLPVLLGLLNSKLADWYFRLGSTNAHVNQYQLYSLPFSHFSPESAEEIEIAEFASALIRHEWSKAFQWLEPHLEEPPFPAVAALCLVRLVERIAEIESARGEIARTERSALSPKAQPYQDLIDRILFRMAGLTDDEAAGLERRLAAML